MVTDRTFHNTSKAIDYTVDYFSVVITPVHTNGVVAWGCKVFEAFSDGKIKTTKKKYGTGSGL